MADLAGLAGIVLFFGILIWAVGRIGGAEG
jgi:hypothetical protein